MADKVQLIKQEIESYKESMKGLEPHSDFRRGQITAFNQIIQFIDSLPEEPASEDLEKATRRYLLNKHVSPLNDIMHQIDLKAEMQYHKDVENAFKEGAEWQKRQMMKDAVECTWGSRATSSLMNNFPNIKCDDKVKIIIVKEE